MDYKRYGGNEDLYRANATDDEPRLKVVMEGEWRGRHFVIGAHWLGNPNAYVEVKDPDYINWEAGQYEDFDGGLYGVNCGSTYFGKAYWDTNDNRKYVGWDYGHAYDYNARYPQLGGKMWDLIDILMEIASAITEIEYLNEHDLEYFNRVSES